MKNLFIFITLCFLSLVSLGQPDSLRKTGAIFSTNAIAEEKNYSLENELLGSYPLNDSINNVFHAKLVALKDKVLEMQKKGIPCPHLISKLNHVDQQYVLNMGEVRLLRDEYFPLTFFFLLPTQGAEGAEFTFYLDTIDWTFLVEERVLSYPDRDGYGGSSILGIYEIKDHMITGNVHVSNYFTTSSGLIYRFTKDKIDIFITMINEDLDRQKALAEKD